MKTLQNRKFAVLIFIIIVLVFTLIGSHRSLSKACNQVEVAFFDKTIDIGQSRRTCPAEQLDLAVSYANRLLSIAKDDVSDDVYNTILESRKALLVALEDRDISDAYAAQNELALAISALDGLTITNNYDEYDTVRSDLFSALELAGEAGYNEYVDQFQQSTIDRFPTNILAALTGVDMPEKYE